MRVTVYPADTSLAWKTYNNVVDWYVKDDILVIKDMDKNTYVYMTRHVLRFEVEE